MDRKLAAQSRTLELIVHHMLSNAVTLSSYFEGCVCLGIGIGWRET